MAADTVQSVIVVTGQNLLGLQSQINAKVLQGYVPLSGTFTVTGGIFYYTMMLSDVLPESISVDNVTGISDLGRQLLAINDIEAIKAEMDVPALGEGEGQALPGNWRPTLEDMQGFSDLLKALLNANSPEAMRSVIGAGDSSVVVGTGAADAKPGDWEPTVNDIKNLSAVIASLLNSTNPETARAAIGAGTSNITIGTDSTQAKAGNWKPATEDISNASDIGKAVIKAANVATALQALTGNSPSADAFLRGDGKWLVPTGTTYQPATATTPGLMTASDKQRLDNIAQPVATAIATGGRPIGTAFIVDSARWADVTYSFSASIGTNLAANSSLTIDAQVDGVTVVRLSLGLVIALSVTLGLNLPFTNSITFRVPPGKQVKFVQSGTAGITVTLACGQEVLL